MTSHPGLKASVAPAFQATSSVTARFPWRIVFGLWLIFLATSSGGFETGDTVVRLATAKSWIAGQGGVLGDEYDGHGAVRGPGGEVFTYYGPLQSILMVPPLVMARFLPLPESLAPFSEPFLVALLVFPAVSAAAIGLLSIALRRMGFASRPASLAAIAFALTGVFWHYARMGQEESLVVLGLALWMVGVSGTKESDPRSHILMVMGLLVLLATRWASMPTAIPLGVATAWWMLRGFVSTRHVPWRALSIGVLGIAALLAYNHYRFGDPFETGYGIFATNSGQPLFRTDGWGRNFAALLLSPSRGLFLFSPIALLCLLGALLGSWPSPAAPLRMLSVVTFLASVGFYSAIWFWYGGNGWGPRYLVGVSVLLVPALCALLTRHPRTEFILPALAALQIFSVMLPASTEDYVRAVADHSRPGACTTWTWDCSPFPDRFIRGTQALANTLNGEPGRIERGYAVMPAHEALETSDFKTVAWWPVRIAFRLDLYDPRLGLLLSVGLLVSGLLLLRQPRVFRDEGAGAADAS